MNPNATSFDWSGYMGRFTHLSNLIGQMVQTPPTISQDLLSLVNVSEYMALFDRVQKYWASTQFQLDPNRWVFFSHSTIQPLYIGVRACKPEIKVFRQYH